jgi:hypothetical protein
MEVSVGKQHFNKNIKMQVFLFFSDFLGNFLACHPEHANSVQVANVK